MTLKRILKKKKLKKSNTPQEKGEGKMIQGYSQT
jgi:hypothetical protein